MKVFRNEKQSIVRLKPSVSSPFLLDGSFFDDGQHGMDKNHLPTIMIFVIGGMTHAEIRFLLLFLQFCTLDTALEPFVNTTGCFSFEIRYDCYYLLNVLEFNVVLF